MDTPIKPASLVELGGLNLEIVERGGGQPLLLLHGAGGPRTGAPFFELLAGSARIVAPSHPGFGASPLPDWVDSIDDLAYAYLDLLERRRLHDVVVVGSSMGGWIAAEMAVKNFLSRISRLVLVGAVGIKVGDRETRDIPDIYALSAAEVAKLAWHDIKLAPKIDELTDAQLVEIARHRESAALYLWEPYMHNPKLRRRLSRITVPTLYIRGAHDGLISQSYAEAYCAAIPNARLETIAAAGHVPEVEQPQAFAKLVTDFIVSAA